MLHAVCACIIRKSREGSWIFGDLTYSENSQNHAAHILTINLSYRCWRPANARQNPTSVLYVLEHHVGVHLSHPTVCHYPTSKFAGAAVLWFERYFRPRSQQAIFVLHIFHDSLVTYYAEFIMYHRR